MKILTAADMQHSDEASVAAGIPIAALMESAGEAVVAFVLRHYPQAAHVMVLCGKGNNGGDGLVAARALAGEGIGIRVLLAARQDDLKGDAAAALARLKDSTSDEIVEELPDLEPDAIDDLAELLGEADLILDAVVGTGFKPPLRGPAAALRAALEKITVPVLAVDLPSGWDADSLEEKSAEAFRADAVVTFTAPKQAHIFGHLTTAVFAPVVVADIGSPADTIHSSPNLHWAGSSKALTEKPRDVNSNKGKFGHILVIGGSFGTAGAPSMASLAALRAGAGLVTAAVPREIVNLVASITPELMVRPLAHDPEGTATAANLANLEALTKGIKVIAIGPGLSTQGESSAFARGVVTGTTLPIVIDADALNAFDPAHVHLLNGRKEDGTARTMVLTPHPGEMARLLNKSVKEVEADRINLARAFAQEHQLTLVLKGWRTLTAHPDGSIAVNTTGNPGLSKGGSGDILTGIIAALLGQYPDNVAEAVEAAVYLHGLAADLVARHLDEKSILATDIISHFTQAFRYRATDPEGFTWITGIQPKPKAPEETPQEIL